jgi:hypothetical protein|tara:strand:- start:1469 stop:2557 length:1089 start_codon:yes stop_codon:yes gene_type:complete
MAQKEYNPNIGEIGFGIPGAQEGLEELYSDYLKPLYDSYGGGLESLKNPDMYQDAVRYPINAVADLYHFIGDIGSDVAQSSMAQLANTELYNPFSEKGGKRELERSESFFPHIPGVDFPNVFTPHAWHSLDAFQSDKFGTPTMIEDNPYAKINKKETQKMFDKAQSEYDSFVKPLMTKELDDRLYEEAVDDYGWSDYIKDNPRGSLNEYYDDLDKRHEKKLFSYQKEKAGDLYENSIKNQMAAKFGIKNEDYFGVGLNKFDLDENYAYTGDPLLEYESPRKDILHKSHYIADVLLGPGAVKAPFNIGRKLFQAAKGPRKANMGEGIMSNRKQIEGPNKISPDLSSRLYNRVDRSAQRRSRRR